VADPVVLRIQRPYATEQDYIVAEAWTIEDKSIVLVDQHDLPKDTLVRFEVILEDGSKPIRAEGKVSRHVPPTGDRPGGLKVRFRRFDAATKRFIERAVAERQSQRRSRRPPPAAPLVLDEEPIPSQPAPSQPEASQPEIASVPDAASDPETASEPATAEPPEARASVRDGSRPTVVAAPAQRDELLERLRERHRARSDA
jgi:hypothetical protein